MANYCCSVRTNYFKVKDSEKFLEIMGKVYGTEDSIDVWTEKDPQRGTLYGFGCYGSIAGYFENHDENDDYDEAYDAFVKKLQTVVDDADAIIIIESGNEKLRYVTGDALIITKDDIKFIDICDVATQTAAKMLNNPNWSTQCSY